MTWIVGLMILGFALVMLEIVIPGGIVGIFGGICLLAAVAVAYQNYRVEGAVISFAIALVGMTACLFFEFKILPKTPMGKRIFLEQTIAGKSQRAIADESIVGQEGMALTALSPSGYVLVGTQKVEAHSRSGFLEEGDRVRVESLDQFKATVSKI